jgi:LmbE family N-acetylglucosaminyl deacetylase
MSKYRHVYLSPHPDDAVLSCGGRIHQLAQVREALLVVTIFAGSPRSSDKDENRVYSDYIEGLHRRWETGADTPALRRAEDQAALRVLGVDFRHLSYLDCVYRQHPLTGEFLYQSDEDIFANVHPVEFPLVAELGERLEKLVGAPDEVTICSPLAVGHHVDHQIVVAAALTLQTAGHRVAFYEDYPYAEIPSDLAAARQLVGGENWQQELFFLSAEDLEAKTTAVLHYRSQLSTFFKDDEEVYKRLHAYAMTIRPSAHNQILAPHPGPCERIWHLTTAVKNRAFSHRLPGQIGPGALFCPPMGGS